MEVTAAESQAEPLAQKRGWKAWMLGTPRPQAARLFCEERAWPLDHGGTSQAGRSCRGLTLALGPGLDHQGSRVSSGEYQVIERQVPPRGHGAGVGHRGCRKHWGPWCGRRTWRRWRVQASPVVLSGVQRAREGRDPGTMRSHICAAAYLRQEQGTLYKASDGSGLLILTVNRGFDSGPGG